MAGLYLWCDSGANIHSCRRAFRTWDELSITEEEWDEMSEKQQEEFARDVAFESADWGYEKADKLPSR